MEAGEGGVFEARRPAGIMGRCYSEQICNTWRCEGGDERGQPGHMRRTARRAGSTSAQKKRATRLDIE
jgi:hypothetical protein